LALGVIVSIATLSLRVQRCHRHQGLVPL